MCSTLENYMIKYLKKQAAFTLIEVLLTVVIIATGLFGIMILYHNAAKDVMEGDINLMAVYLARERMEQLISDKVANGYASVVNENYDTLEPDVTVGNSHFERSFNIYEVNRDDLITTEVGSGFKRVDMTVSWGALGNQNIVLSTLISNY